MDDNGDARSGNSRLESLQLCQQAFEPHQQPMMIFDEAEDLFPLRCLPGSSRTWMGSRKVGSTRCSSPTRCRRSGLPIRWVTWTQHSCVASIWSSRCRRRRVRFDIACWIRCWRPTTSAPLARELVELEDLAPDEIERLVRTTSHLQNETGAQREQVLKQVFEQVRKVAGRRTSPEHQPLPGHYRPEFINADVDLGMVADNLIATRCGRLCLYGAPGSGKSAYAQYLAERMGAPCWFAAPPI